MALPPVGRPSWTAGLAGLLKRAPASIADEHAAIGARGMEIKKGIFGAEMEVELVNDGPMTIWLDSAAG